MTGNHSAKWPGRARKDTTVFFDVEWNGAVAPRQRTANPRCAAVGIDRAAPSNRYARAQPNSSPLLSPVGSTVLDFVLTLVAAMARQPDHRPARDSLALAP